MIWAACVMVVTIIAAAIFFARRSDKNEAAKAAAVKEAEDEVSEQVTKARSLAGMAIASRRLRRVRKD